MLLAYLKVQNEMSNAKKHRNKSKVRIKNLEDQKQKRELKFFLKNPLQNSALECIWIQKSNAKDAVFGQRDLEKRWRSLCTLYIDKAYSMIAFPTIRHFVLNPMVELLFHTTQSDYNVLYIILENSLSLSIYIYIQFNST
jgi:hypothetical protein